GAAALRNNAQGVTGSVESPAARSEHAGALSPAARPTQTRPQAEGLLRRASPCRGHREISRSPHRRNLAIGWKGSLASREGCFARATGRGTSAGRGGPVPATNSGAARVGHAYSSLAAGPRIPPT